MLPMTGPALEYEAAYRAAAVERTARHAATVRRRLHPEDEKSTAPRTGRRWWEGLMLVRLAR